MRLKDGMDVMRVTSVIKERVLAWVRYTLWRRGALYVSNTDGMSPKLVADP